MSKTRRNNGRGIATRGWKTHQPNTQQKTVMLRKCGNKCFLGKNKTFPICKKNTCKISPQGVYSAYIRARQYSSKSRKYKIIAKKANNILVKMGVKR
jgi:hypothetical protein